MKNNIPATIHRTKIWTNAAYLALNFCDRYDIFTTFGQSKIRLESFGNAFLVQHNPALLPEIDFPQNRLDEIDFESHFSWSIGARASLWECCCFGVGGEVQYFRTTPNLNYASDRAVFLEYRQDVKSTYDEWQVGLAAYYRLSLNCSFLSSTVPYVGIKWSDAYFDMGNALIPDSTGISITHSLTLINQHSYRHFGYVVGVTTVFCNRLELSVEGRFRDERALYVNGQVRF